MALLTLAYTTQFQFWYREDLAGSAGLSPYRRRVTIRRNGYSGEVIELTPADEPIEIAYDGADSRFEPILPAKCTLSLYCEEAWQAESLYVNTDRELQVVIELDTTDTGDAYEIDWIGWILPQDLKEDFMFKPYGVTVSAACGLSTLKTRPLLDANGARLKDYPLVSTVIRTALALADTVPGMVSGVNLFETQDVADGQTQNGLVRPERDPLNRTRQSAASLVTDKNEALSAYDTLIKELEPFGCRVAQIKGQWFVIRADEAAGGWDKWNTGSTATIHTRQYTQADPDEAPSSDTSTDLNVFVGPGFGNTVLAGTTTWLENPKQGVRVEQTFGSFLNKLDNGNFDQVDNTGLPVGWLRKNISDPNKAKRIGIGTEADPYRVRIYGWEFENYEEDNSKGIHYQYHWDPNTEQATIIANEKVNRTLTFDFRLYNARAAKVVIRASSALPDVPFWWMLGEGGVWTINPKRGEQRKGIIIFNDIVVNNIDKTKPGWQSATITIPALGAPVKDLDIMLCSAQPLAVFDSSGNITGPVDDPNAYIEYANVSLTKEDKSINVTGTQRTIVQKDKTAETVLTMTLGDVPSSAQPESHSGTLYKLQDGNVPTTLWYRPNANILTPNPTGDNVGKTLIDWNTESRAKQDMYAALTFEGTIFGRLPYGIHSVLRFWDIGEEDENGVFVMYPFQITRLTSRFRSMEHDVTAVRMLTGVNLPSGAAYTDTREWVTPDGTILIDYDPTTNDPLTPSIPFLPPDVAIKKVIGSLGLLPGVGLPTNTPALFVPTDANDPQFSATGYVAGFNRGTVFSALRRTILFETPP